MADAEVGVGHVPRARLDPREDHLELVLPVEDAVKQADGTVARVAEQVRNLLPDEVLGHEIGSPQLRHVRILP